MRRLALAAALTFGCDDPEVSSALTSALINGSVSAQVVCEGPANCSGITGSGSGYKAKVSATRFQDGTHLLVTAWLNWYGTDFVRLGEPVVGRTPVSDRGILVTEVADGLATLELTGPDAAECGSAVFKTFTLDTDCTGFNLEAFGVE